MVLYGAKAGPPEVIEILLLSWRPCAAGDSGLFLRRSTMAEELVEAMLCCFPSAEERPAVRVRRRQTALDDSSDARLVHKQCWPPPASESQPAAYPRQIFEIVLQCGPAHILALLADASSFTNRVKLAMGSSARALHIEPWLPGTVEVCRSLTWDSPITHPLSPIRSTRIQEKQVCSRGRDGTVMLRTAQHHVDVPSGSSFRICYDWRFYPTETVEGPRTKLCVTHTVIWSASSWFRQITEDSAFQESCAAYARVLPSLLMESLSELDSTLVNEDDGKGYEFVGSAPCLISAELTVASERPCMSCEGAARLLRLWGRCCRMDAQLPAEHNVGQHTTPPPTSATGKSAANGTLTTPGNARILI